MELQKPSLPEEAKSVIPAATALAAAVVIPGVAESHADEYPPPPKLVLIIMIGLAGSSYLWVTAHSQPAIMADSVALPVLPLEILME